MSASSIVLFAGSSAVEPGSPLPAALAAELGLAAGEWRAIGIRGSRLTQWIEPELPSDLAGNVRAIVVLLTANDPHPTPHAVAVVDRALRHHSSTVVWLPPMPYRDGSHVRGRDALMRAALEGSGVVWVERTIHLEDAHWAPDRVHLTRAGYVAYARQVGGELRTRLTPSASVARVTTVAEVLTGRGLRLPVSGLDLLWLTRAVVGEGGTHVDAEAVSSTLIRRWALLRDASEASPLRSLTDLVVGRFAGEVPYDGEARTVALRGYSQPVAVQWRRDGHARRRRIRGLSWDDIELGRRAAVLRIVTGSRDLVAAPAVHFAAPALVAERLRQQAGWRRVSVAGAQNHFVSTTASRRMDEPRLQGLGVYEGASSRQVGVDVVALGGVALLAGVGLAAWATRRGDARARTK